MASHREREPILANKNLYLVRGIPMPTTFNKETVEGVFDFMPGDDDVIIATYPKTGTTWMQYIIHQIFTKGESFPEFNDMLLKVIPFLELSGVAAVEALTTKPRVCKHHLPYNMMKKNPRSKIIYTYRKPEDTFVSLYNFLKNMGSNTDFDGCFEDFLMGDVMYGNYFDHILSYLEHKDDPNMLFVSYEKLHAYRTEEILRVAKFLGEEHYDNLGNDRSLLRKVIERTSFDYMKKNLTLFWPKLSDIDPISENSQESEVKFFRKGTVGDGKMYLKENQLRNLRELAKEKLKETEILKEWYD